WEGVGLCSYLLIGFWYTDPAKAWAGRKAFVANRIGDFGFLLGMFLLTLLMGAFNDEATSDNFANSHSMPEQAAASFHSGYNKVGPLNFHGLEEMTRAVSVQKRPRQLALEDEIDYGPLKGFQVGHVLTAVLLLFMRGAAGNSAQLPLY